MKILVTIMAFFIIALFGIGFIYLANIDSNTKQILLAKEDLRGSAVVHEGFPYTLNFSQQEELLALLNESQKKKVLSFPPNAHMAIERIVLYRFSDAPDLVLTPLNEELSLLQISGDKTGMLLDIKHPDKLQELLKNTYDK